MGSGVFGLGHEPMLLMSEVFELVDESSVEEFPLDEPEQPARPNVSSTEASMTKVLRSFMRYSFDSSSSLLTFVRF